MKNNNKSSDFKSFTRNNPKSDYFPVHRFHHVEFYCGDAANTSGRFSHALGLPITHKSDLSTGNSAHASYLLRSKSQRLGLLFTAAAYSPALSDPSSAAIPGFSAGFHRKFTASHGLAVRAMALQVSSAAEACDMAVSRGAELASPPIVLSDGETTIAEVKMYGDVVLRFVSCPKDPPSSFFLPGFEFNDRHAGLDYGLTGLDHAAGNVPEMASVVEHFKKFTGIPTRLRNLTKYKILKKKKKINLGPFLQGFHEFAEFTAEDVGTAESGLNSVVLANNTETVLLSVNEPIYGTKRRSQIQTYLEHNEGPGLQHLALASEDIFKTLREMRKWSGLGGFDFLPPPPVTYYKNLKNRAGDVLSEEQIDACEELGILVDRDDQGTLLQIFTQPVGDRPTIFIEIIQRIGCMHKDEKGNLYQKGACGGFGKGNFSELFKSIEEYEKMLEAKQVNVECECLIPSRSS